MRASGNYVRSSLGDLFVIRVAGNIIAPSLVGRVEFAAERFDTKLVVVRGRTHCDAIEATPEFLQNPAAIILAISRPSSNA